MAIEAAGVVTGAASGIGREIVLALLAARAPVIAFDRDQSGLASLDAAGGRLHKEVVDVADEASIGPAIDRGIDAVGGLGGIVNAAGIGRSIPAAQTDAALFRKILDVNLVGSFVVAREAAARMPRGGSIVNISSVSGIRGNCGRAAYGASKGGTDALTRILGTEWAANNIRVNAVAPGPIDTPLTRDVHDEETRAEWGRLAPMGRYGETREVTGAVLFLLDKAASSYITGQTLCVDGGFVAAGFRHWRWHLDEMDVKLNGKMVYLCQAADHEGEVLESYVTRTRDKAAALTFMRKALKRHGSPEAITIDGLRSYGAAMTELGCREKQEVGRWANNRVENSQRRAQDNCAAR